LRHHKELSKCETVFAVSRDFLYLAILLVYVQLCGRLNGELKYCGGVAAHHLDFLQRMATAKFGEAASPLPSNSIYS
jgi:hypothetical protein